MGMFFSSKKNTLLIFGSLVLLFAPCAEAGTYTLSAHGNSVTGVDRSTVDSKFSSYATGNCGHCHEQHASIEGSEPLPSSGTDTASAALGFATEQSLCFECHDSGGPAPPSADVHTEFTTLPYIHGQNGSTGTDYMAAYDNRHRPGESFSSAFDAANRHSECADCHNPHKANDANPILGATGISVTNISGWTTTYGTTVAEVSVAAEQYKVCFKCHSGWAGYGTGTDQGKEFNTQNLSYHNIEGSANPPSSNTYGNFNIGTGTVQDARNQNWSLNNYAYAMMPRYNGYTNLQLRNVAMGCSDCHGNSTAAPQGVHGSPRPSILKVPPGSPYTTWDFSITVRSRDNCWCFNCHDPSFTNSGFSGNDGELHVEKHEKDSAHCMTCHVKIPHGWDLRAKMSKPQSMVTTYGAEYAPYNGSDSNNSGIGTDPNNWPTSGTWTETDAASGTGNHERCN